MSKLKEIIHQYVIEALEEILSEEPENYHQKAKPSVIKPRVKPTKPMSKEC